MFILRIPIYIKIYGKIMNRILKSDANLYRAEVIFKLYRFHKTRSLQ